jgi:microcystin-dependent protein
MGGGHSTTCNQNIINTLPTPKPNIGNIKLGDNTNSVSTIKTQNNPQKQYQTLDLNNCNYKPINNTTNLPSIGMESISQLYYNNQFQIKNLTVNNSFNQIPRGIVIAWYGKTNNIPYGWALCDGKNCTPDLRGRSILGLDLVTNKNKLGEYGGEENHLLTVGEIPSHTHNYGSYTTPNKFISIVGTKPQNTFVGKTNGIGYTYVNTPNGNSHNNMPPYFVCNYIMKL